MKVCLIGDVFGQSGYSTHVRFMAEALDDLGYDVSVDCNKPQNWELQSPDKLFSILQREVSNETVVYIGLPPFWSLKIADKPNHFIGFLIWEGNTIPEYWIEHLADERVDQIWVASSNTKQAIQNTTTDEKILNKIYIVPEGVDTGLFKRNVVQRHANFTFVCNKGWAEGANDRGGVQYLVKAFKEEFKKEEPVLLQVKINKSYCPPNWNISNELNNINTDMVNGADMIIALDNIQYKGIPDAVYNRGDCFVCPTRGEAFGLTMAEAMACELPVITTNFGGQTDFIKDGETGLLVDFKLEEVRHNILYEGIQWATPDIQDLRKKMRWAFDNKDKIKEMGLKAREYVVVNLQWKHAGLKAKEALDKL